MLFAHFWLLRWNANSKSKCRGMHNQNFLILAPASTHVVALLVPLILNYFQLVSLKPCLTVIDTWDAYWRFFFFSLLNFKYIYFIGEDPTWSFWNHTRDIMQNECSPRLFHWQAFICIQKSFEETMRSLERSKARKEKP